jgi:hypothetical protein
MYKEVNIESFLNGEDVNPSIEELQMFRPRKKDDNPNKDKDDDDDDDDKDGVG